MTSVLGEEKETTIQPPTSNTEEGVALSELINRTHQLIQFICAKDKGFYLMLTVTSEPEISPVIFQLSISI